MKGEIVVIPFPFSDLSGSKRRPALVIADWGADDIIPCQITSKLKKDGFEITLTNSDFESGKLPVESHIRPNKLFTSSRNNIISVAGKISKTKHEEVVDSIYKMIALQ